MVNLVSFYTLFLEAYLLLFLGVTERIDSFHADKAETMPVTLNQGLAYMALLGANYNLHIDGKFIVPVDECAAFEMFAQPFSVLADKLPSELLQKFPKDSILWTLDALIEKDGNEDFFLTYEGENFLYFSNKLRESISAQDTYSEYLSQSTFEELLVGEDYEAKRIFLIDPANTYISESRAERTEAQNKFIESYRFLFQKVYSEVVAEKYYKCKRCNCLVVPDVRGRIRCARSTCVGKSTKLEDLNLKGSVYALTSTAIRYIYQPGILEHKMFEEAKKSPRVIAHEFYPGFHEGEHDTWDLYVKLNDGREFLFDAKDVKNPYWLVQDQRHLVAGKEFAYVVPNARGKKYISYVNEQLKGTGARCLTFNEFVSLVGGGKNE